VYENKTDETSREWHIKHDLTKADKELLIKSTSDSLTDSDTETTMNLNNNLSVERRNNHMAVEKKAAPAAKKTTVKKTATKNPAAKKAGRPAKKPLGKIILEIDGQQIDIKAIEKKAAKLGGDVYVVASEKKIFDKDGKSVELF
jgi:hypothetical protein